MRHLATVTVSIAVFLAEGTHIIAQSSTGSPLHGDLPAASRFAPILRFATDEIAYPILPHGWAFDGIDNDGDELYDLDDLDELDYDAVDLPTLITKFAALTERRRAPRRRVLYYGPRPFKVNDRQYVSPVSWPIDNPSRPIDVIEYWLYYPFDQGYISPHKHDAEHFFVFLERHAPVGVEPLTLPLASVWPTDAIRAVVGAGHEAHTANNVLVVGRKPEEVERRIFPRRLPQHMPVLVELGKHASAPDRNFDGRFDFGMDANVFRDSSWGSRDHIAASLGQFSMGPFRIWYSFPSDRRLVSVEAGYFQLQADERDGAYDILAGLRPRQELAYTLFPAKDLEDLYLILSRPAGDPILLDQLRQDVGRFLTEHQTCFWGEVKRPYVNVSPEALAIMRTWPCRRNAKCGEGGDKKEYREIWKHGDHVDPNQIFKLHLYPRFAFGGGAHWELPRGRPQWRVSIHVADQRIWNWVPWVGGRRMLFDSHIESYYGYSPERGEREFGFLFKNFRGSYGGLYGGGGFRKEILKGYGDLDPGDQREIAEQLKARSGNTIEHELEVIKGYVRESSWHGFVEGGLALSSNLGKFRSLKRCWFEARAGVRFEPNKRVPDEISAKRGALQGIRVQISGTFHFGIAKPQHPLAY